MAQPLLFITRKQAILFASFLVLYEFLTYIANDMIMPSMLSVAHSFNAPESTVATSLTAYVLGGASLQVLLGPLSDTYGRRPVMLVGASLFCVFTLLIACSYSMQAFLVARFFQGMGLCFIVVIGYATVQEIFAEMDALRLIAIMANAAILAPLLGPLLGAVLISYTSWRIIFIIIALFALLAWWGLGRYMPESLDQPLRNGEILPKTPFSFKKIYANYKALFKNYRFCYAVLASGLIGTPCIAWIALSPLILVTYGKLSVIEYGLWQIPLFGATILGNWVLHKLTYSFNLKTIIFIGCLINSLGLLLMAFLPYFWGPHYSYLFPGLILYFFALSIITAPLNRFTLYSTAVSKGTASAMMSLGAMLIQALGIEVASLLYEQHNNLHFGLYCNGMGILFLLFIGLSFLCSSAVLDKKKNRSGKM